MLPSFLQVLWLRLLTRLASLYDRYCCAPKPIHHDFKVKIKSTISAQPGPVELIFYNLPSIQNDNLRPVVINFHGGGWIFGDPQMDARWATRVVETGATFISVGYRLAPAHRYPTPIEDCVDAIIWVHDNAAKYHLDTTKITLSGFSAGGNMVFASAIRLQQERGDKVPLAGIISFYPLVDRTISDEDKHKTNPKARGSLPPSVQKLFTDCYLGKGVSDLSSPYLSPGIAPTETLRAALPESISIYTCGLDFLLDEAETFRERLASIGKNVRGRIVEDVVHAWDRYPSKNGNPSMDAMYTDAVSDLRRMWV